MTGGGFPSPSPSESSTSDSLISQPLRSLLNETSDFLLSPDGSLILTLTLDRLFSLSISKLEPAFSTPISGPVGDEARGARFEDVTEKQTKLASLLPVLTRLSAAGLEGQAGVLRGGHGNEFVEVRLIVICVELPLIPLLCRRRLSTTFENCGSLSRSFTQVTTVIISELAIDLFVVRN